MAHTIPAVLKTMDLLRLLAEPEGETTTKALAYRLRIPRTTCYRILRSLLARDWVRCLDGGRHVLSLGLLPLMGPIRPTAQLSDAVGPILVNLASRTGLTAKVSIRQGDSAVTIARCESPRETSVAVRLGASFHLAYGSSGAVLLSDLAADNVQELIDRAPGECWANQKPADVWDRLKVLRAKGWCADVGSYRASCHAISAPLREASGRNGSGGGRVLAAMTIIGFPHELPREKLEGCAKALVEGARQAEKAIRMNRIEDGGRFS